MTFLPDSIPSFCFGFSGIVSGFDPFVLFWDLQHHARIRSFPFVSSSLISRPDSILYFDSSSLALCPDSIPSFCFGFSDIMSGFDPFVLFPVLSNRTWIRSLRFISGSLASRTDSIFRFVSGSLASRSDSIAEFCFGFSSIAPRFDSFLFYFGFSGIASRFIPLF